VVEKPPEKKGESEGQTTENEPMGWLSVLRGYMPFIKDVPTVDGAAIKKQSLKRRWKEWTDRERVELPDRKYFGIEPSSQGDRRPQENRSSEE
ncbi:hypothetical protein LTS18_001409, partial [Coniosporium uncinatum]